MLLIGIFKQNEVVLRGNRCLLRERWNMSQLGCIFLLLRVLAILFTKCATWGQLVDANICVDTGGDEFRGI